MTWAFNPWRNLHVKSNVNPLIVILGPWTRRMIQQRSFKHHSNEDWVHVRWTHKLQPCNLCSTVNNTTGTSHTCTGSKVRTFFFFNWMYFFYADSVIPKKVKLMSPRIKKRRKLTINGNLRFIVATPLYMIILAYCPKQNEIRICVSL